MFALQASYLNLLCLTNAVGQQLKSVRSKKHLWLSVNVTHQHGESKCLEKG